MGFNEIFNAEVLARERCLLEQQSLCKSAVCSVKKCLPLAGVQTWLPQGGLVRCARKEGSLLSTLSAAQKSRGFLPRTQEPLSCAPLASLVGVEAEVLPDAIRGEVWAASPTGSSRKGCKVWGPWAGLLQWWGECPASSSQFPKLSDPGIWGRNFCPPSLISCSP